MRNVVDMKASQGDGTLPQLWKCVVGRCDRSIVVIATPPSVTRRVTACARRLATRKRQARAAETPDEKASDREIRARPLQQSQAQIERLKVMSEASNDSVNDNRHRRNHS